MLNEWSKDFNQANPKFDDGEELSQFVIDVFCLLKMLSL